jgi:hypothetical protein
VHVPYLLGGWLGGWYGPWGLGLAGLDEVGFFLLSEEGNRIGIYLRSRGILLMDFSSFPFLVFFGFWAGFAVSRPEIVRHQL